MLLSHFKTFSMTGDKILNIWFLKHDDEGAVENYFNCRNSKQGSKIMKFVESRWESRRGSSGR
jgi:hypothetical protein